MNSSLSKSSLWQLKSRRSSAPLSIHHPIKARRMVVTKATLPRIPNPQMAQDGKDPKDQEHPHRKSVPMARRRRTPIMALIWFGAPGMSLRTRQWMGCTCPALTITMIGKSKAMLIAQPTRCHQKCHWRRRRKQMLLAPTNFFLRKQRLGLIVWSFPDNLLWLSALNLCAVSLMLRTSFSRRGTEATAIPKTITTKTTHQKSRSETAR